MPPAPPLAESKSARDPGSATIEIVPVGPTDPLLREAFDKVLVPTAPPWLGPPSVDAIAIDIASTFVLLADGEPLGMISGEWYEHLRVLFFTYLAVVPDTRARGLGSRLTEHAMRYWSTTYRPCVIVAEVEVPGVHPVSVHGDPVKRVRFHGRLGGRALDIPYFQPSGDGGRRLHQELLVCFRPDPSLAGATSDTVAPGLMRAFMEDYLRRAEGGVATDAATTALLDALSVESGVRLIDLDDAGLAYLAARWP
jgi:GNAT superfamily N-acetyltransferase